MGDGRVMATVETKTKSKETDMKYVIKYWSVRFSTWQQCDEYQCAPEEQLRQLAKMQAKFPEYTWVIIPVLPQNMTQGLLAIQSDAVAA